MKEEGNVYFKDKEFLQAFEMYSDAIMIGNCAYERTQSYDTARRKLIAIVSANRALCLLKMVILTI